MNLVIDNVPVTLNMNTHFDEVVFKNSGGGGAGGAQLALKSQILVKLYQLQLLKVIQSRKVMLFVL